jgi:hypothetical protein
MNDPLRYFLDEGFGSIYSYQNEEGRLEARMRWVKGYKGFEPTLKNSNGTSILSIGGKDYDTDDEFMRNYTVLTADEAEAESLIAEENRDWEIIKNTPIGA